MSDGNDDALDANAARLEYLNMDMNEDIQIGRSEASNTTTSTAIMNLIGISGRDKISLGIKSLRM